MRFKASQIVDSTNSKENEIIQLLHDYGRSDANCKQVWYGVNIKRKKMGKRTISKNKIEKIILNLVDKDIVFAKKYKGDLVHYLLKEYVAEYERRMNE